MTFVPQGIRDAFMSRFSVQSTEVSMFSPTSARRSDRFPDQIGGSLHDALMHAAKVLANDA